MDRYGCPHHAGSHKAFARLQTSMWFVVMERDYRGVQRFVKARL